MELPRLLANGVFQENNSLSLATMQKLDGRGLQALDKATKPAAQAKKVSFELLLDEGAKTRARIPLRVVIHPHDTSESIITTIKNFYGMYEGESLSFEDDKGNVLIPSYHNFASETYIYIRTSPSNLALPTAPVHDSPRKVGLGEPFQMPPPHETEHHHVPSRPLSRLACKRSISPQYGRGRRSVSQQKASSNAASRGSSAHRSFNEDATNGYSDSEGGQSSITGSRKAKSEQFASAEISLENVLQDGRRKGPSFDSSVSASLNVGSAH